MELETSEVTYLITLVGFIGINSKLDLESDNSHSSEESNKSNKSRLHVTFKECKNLAKSVHNLSKSLVDQYISDASRYGGKQFGQFLPADLCTDQLGAKASSGDMLPNNNEKTIRSKICHGCHGELGNGAHTGSATGKDRCTLPHSLRCLGNIIETDSWRACPSDYQLNPDALYMGATGFENTLDPSAFRPDGQARSTPAGSGSSTPTGQQVGDQANVLPGFDAESESRPLGARSKNHTQSLDQPLGATVNVNRLPQQIQRTSGYDGNFVPNAQYEGDLPPYIQRQIDDFRASNQAANSVPDRPNNNFTIADLRKDKILREQVEYGIHDLREQIPSLSRAPTAGYDRLPPRNFVQGNSGYEWVTDSSGRKHLVKLGDMLFNSGQNGNLQQGPYGCFSRQVPHQYDSIQLDRQKHVQQGTEENDNFRLEYRCSPTTGRTWRVRIPVSPVSPPPRQIPKWEWRIDPYTGERYQIEVFPLSNPDRVSVPCTRDKAFQHYTQRGVGYSQDSSSAATHMISANPTTSGGQPATPGMAGIYRLDKPKKTSAVVEFAKHCPAKWAKGTNNNTINLPLYSWSILAEIEAAMSGRIQALQEGELLGRLRHLKNTLEICCLNSTSSDFTTYGWVIARDYAFKVEDEVLQGLASWSSMTPGIRTNTLVSAQMDCPRASQKGNRTGREDDKVKLCTTYNKCKSKNKCEYELANPDKQCQRKHECSWCRANANQSNRHQEWDCKKKEASG